MEQDILTQAKDLQKKNNEVIEVASRGVLNTIADIQDTFAVFIPEEDVAEKAAIEYINNALWSAVQMEEKLMFLFAKPRIPSGQDKVFLLPGQHPGIFLAFSVPDTGEIIKINAYGGLRGLSGEDTHDSDRTLRKGHTTRTEDISSQPTLFNFHMQIPNGEIIFDTWIQYQPHDKFVLHNTMYGGQPIDVHPSILSDHNNFKQLAAGLHTSVGSLLRLIPW